MARSAEQAGDVDHLLRRLAEADAALHRERAQRRERLLLAQPRCFMMMPLARSTTLRSASCVRVSSSSARRRLVGLEALDRHAHDRLEAARRDAVDDVGRDARAQRRADGARPAASSVNITTGRGAVEDTAASCSSTSRLGDSVSISTTSGAVLARRARAARAAISSVHATSTPSMAAERLAAAPRRGPACRRRAAPSASGGMQGHAICRAHACSAINMPRPDAVKIRHRIGQYGHVCRKCDRLGQDAA